MLCDTHECMMISSHKYLYETSNLTDECNYECLALSINKENPGCDYFCCNVWEIHTVCIVTSIIFIS